MIRKCNPLHMSNWPCPQQPSGSNLQQACGFISLCSYLRQQHGGDSEPSGCCSCRLGELGQAHADEASRSHPATLTARLIGRKRKRESLCSSCGVFVKPLSPGAAPGRGSRSTKAGEHSNTALSDHAAPKADILRIVRFCLSVWSSMTCWVCGMASDAGASFDLQHAVAARDLSCGCCHRCPLLPEKYICEIRCSPCMILR